MYKLVKSEMKKHSEWSIDSAAIGVAWLDDQVQLKNQFLLPTQFVFIYVSFSTIIFIIFNDTSACLFP